MLAEYPIPETGRLIRLLTGDITKVPADAIVNAANAGLRGGAGVDGAIHRAGGPSLMAELDSIRPKLGGRLAPGGAVVTTAGNLPARYVIHTAGPVYQDGGHGEPGHLARCYQTCLELAEQYALASISFPAISTGVYGYPVRDAAAIATREIARYLRNPTRLQIATIVLFHEDTFEIYATELVRGLGQAS